VSLINGRRKLVKTVSLTTWSWTDL